MTLPASALFASAADVSLVAHKLALELPPQPPCAAPRLLQLAWPWPWRLLQLALLPSPLLAAAVTWAWRHLARMLLRGSKRSQQGASAASKARQRSQLYVSALMDAFEASGCSEALLAAPTLRLAVAGDPGASPVADADWQAAVAGGPLTLDLQSGALTSVLQKLPRRAGIIALAARMTCRRGPARACWALREREQRHTYWSIAVFFFAGVVLLAAAELNRSALSAAARALAAALAVAAVCRERPGAPGGGDL